MNDDLIPTQLRDDPSRSPYLRKRDARKFRVILNEFRAQLGQDPTAAEQVLLANAATLALLCERDARSLILNSDAANLNSYRRNLQALRTTMQVLGLAAHSRDVTKRDRNRGQASILGQLIQNGE
jgi:hypothetical protein